jgi:hypothetical protein
MWFWNTLFRRRKCLVFVKLKSWTLESDMREWSANGEILELSAIFSSVSEGEWSANGGLNVHFNDDCEMKAKV